MCLVVICGWTIAYLALLLVLDLAIWLVHKGEIARVGHDFLERKDGEISFLEGADWNAQRGTYFHAYSVPDEKRDLLIEVANVPLEREIAFALQRDVALELVQRLLNCIGSRRRMRRRGSSCWQSKSQKM
jgi:hypothetical protein